MNRSARALIRVSRTLPGLRGTPISRRTYADLGQRPGPPPLPKADQEEFERLQREAQERPVGMHPAVRDTYPEFTGEVNPATGEVGGPKQDPLRHGDYSFNGRVTDF